MGIIYKIINPNCKVYIGKTVNLKQRIRCYKLKTLKPTTVIHKSIIKYGWDNHAIEIVETADNELLNEREVFWISELKTNLFKYPKGNGMNLTDGADGGNPILWMKDKVKLNIAVAKRTGKNNCRYGKVLDEELRKRIAKSVSAANIKNGTNVPKWGCEKSYAKSRKPVICYNLDGVFIGEYISANHAAKELNVSRRDICSVANGKQTQCHGILIKFRNSETYPLKINTDFVKFKSVDKAVICINKETKTITEYDTVEEAANDLGIRKIIIKGAANDSRRKVNPLITRPNKKSKYNFIYKDFYSQLKTA